MYEEAARRWESCSAGKGRSTSGFRMATSARKRLLRDRQAGHRAQSKEKEIRTCASRCGPRSRFPMGRTPEALGNLAGLYETARWTHRAGGRPRISNTRWTVDNSQRADSEKGRDLRRQAHGKTDRRRLCGGGMAHVLTLDPTDARHRGPPKKVPRSRTMGTTRSLIFGRERQVGEFIRVLETQEASEQDKAPRSARS